MSERADSGSSAPSATAPLHLTQIHLLRQSEIRLAAAGYGDGLRLILRAFVPGGQGVASVGNVFDLVVPAVIGLCKIRSGTDDQISRHVGVHVAKQRHHTWLVESKG